jgi:hypothetical protein
VYTRDIADHFVVRGLFEVGGVIQPFAISDYAGHSVSTPGRLSLACGIGFGGSP